jgi:hypothetical protein
VIAEEDRWSRAGRNVLGVDTLDVLRRALEESPVIVEHRFYRAARSPDRLVFDDFDELRDYLKQKARPGDSFYFWNYLDLCRDDNALTAGKYPDNEGRVPEGGAY